jgi:hypothetical protein
LLLVSLEMGSGAASTARRKTIMSNEANEMRAVCTNVEREAIGRTLGVDPDEPTIGDALALALADDPTDRDLVGSALAGLIDDVAIAQVAIEMGDWGAEGIAPFVRRLKGRLEALAIVQTRARKAVLDSVVVAQPPAPHVPADVRTAIEASPTKWSPWTIAAVAALHQQHPMPASTWVSFLNWWEEKLHSRPDSKVVPIRARSRKRG